MKDNYHHGNLKHDLIETSIHIISEKGFDALSLRGVSKLCGVSHNAIYRHFENKEKLIAACRTYVTERMMECLNEALDGLDIASAEALRCFCISFISFYQKYPTYYSALCRNTDMKLVFSDKNADENYPPLYLFHKVCFAYGTEKGWRPETTLSHMTQLWALMHGLTALTISDNVVWDTDWRTCLDDVIERIGV